VVVTMGCGDACPIFPGKRYEDWVLDDPAGLEINAVRPIRDEIARRVNELLDQISAST
jgi:arsenate reductase (thioredoxin)